MQPTEVTIAVQRMSKDIASAASTMTDEEARFLVDAYYIMQEDRKRSNNQVRALGESAEPNSVLVWLADQSTTLENQIKRALDKYTQAHPMGECMRQVKGIGPVLSAGLLAHIDISKAQTAGAIYRYAGLDPTMKWEKGQKRPWNATLKTLCWKIGQSFMKLSNDEECFYGVLYRKQKAIYVEKNEALGFKDIADVRAGTVGKTTDAYKAYSIGKLPPAHVDAMARRYAVKMFISHMFERWYEKHHGTKPPKPYAIAIKQHAHYIAPPF